MNPAFVSWGARKDPAAVNINGAEKNCEAIFYEYTLGRVVNAIEVRQALVAEIIYVVEHFVVERNLSEVVSKKFRQQLVRTLIEVISLGGVILAVIHEQKAAPVNVLFEVFFLGFIECIMPFGGHEEEGIFAH